MVADLLIRTVPRLNFRKGLWGIVCKPHRPGMISCAYAKIANKDGIDESKIKYNGFDGNSEKQIGFACFLKADGKFTELVGSDGDNSHFPMLSRYIKMLNA